MLNDNQRKLVIKDIANWKNEYEMNGNWSDKEFDNYLDALRGLSDEELKKWWGSTVGEWVASRKDADHPDEEFKRLLDGEETGYGYLNPVSV